MDSSSDDQYRYSYSPTLTWNPAVHSYFVKAYGHHRFSLISRALTRPPTYSCIRVNTLNSTTDSVVDKLTPLLSDMLPTDAACLSDQTNDGSLPVGSHPHIDPLNLFASGCSNSSIYKCSLPALDNVLFVKGTGPLAVDYGPDQRQPMKEVIVSRKCAEAVLRGAQVFVPGVLACSSHVENGDTVAVSVAVEQPDHCGGWNFGFTRGTVLKGTGSDPLYFERKGLYIGQGTAMMSRAGMFRALKGIAVEMKSRIYNLPSLNGVLEGEIFLQNLPSIITARVLDPQEGEKILDMCAAPGGKTTAIAILMMNRGEVIAVDRSHNKVFDILKLASEMGLNCISAYKLDALKAVCREADLLDSASQSQNYNVVGVNNELDFPLQRCMGTAEYLIEKSGEAISDKAKENSFKVAQKFKNGPGRNHSTGGRVQKSKGFMPNSFDRVLLDAPCSALGLRPRLFAGEETIESLRNHGKYQRRMFDQAVRLVRPGGVLVYSTCTINPGENEAVVRYALDKYKFLSLSAQHPKVGGPGIVGIVEGCEGKYEEWLRPGEEELVQRFDPSSPLDTIGFFIAKFDVGRKE